MLHIVLYEPEIPPNTGNIIRLAANTGAALHLIHPLGFELDSARARRAGLDYHELARVQEYDSLDHWRESVQPGRVFAITTRGQARYDAPTFRDGDALLFGPETRGLPESVLDALPSKHCLRLPMREGSRSLNLSNAVAVVVYEAWSQLGFPGGT
ncbi:tRNA (cytidine(34)-2'-O)-methyltransferase [Thioalkalivibrio sp. AKL19]|uniref:tRNA (cytidine(34)-2'-O)-methyltransferase n=1 Tax=Thioalkalivibrio sp. AKL19 TaxID=1266914 RepID=UPI000402943C|nr:tRNA (cytidine(34)-2'-O)-methyltransferase [Thioalkalivibrio sp. AKL19]